MIFNFITSILNLIRSFIALVLRNIFNENSIIRFKIVQTLLAQRRKMHKYIFPALMYPSVLRIYYSLSRYLRMGEIYNISYIVVF